MFDSDRPGSVFAAVSPPADVAASPAEPARVPLERVEAQNCWAGGAGSTDALAGTSDGGSSWSVVTSDTSNEGGYVSRLSVSTCVAVTDNGVWVTSDDGGLPPAG
jgi:photosystem II stability/assembly factor-like uncharacterized protein